MLSSVTEPLPPRASQYFKITVSTIHVLVKKNVIGKLEEEMSRQKEVQILRPNLIKREISRILNIIFPKKDVKVYF